jgi:aryl-alcohol dehydrogenase-like predicted oxidoreductase
MRYIEVEGERLSVVGLGTWQFGSREWGYGPHYARHDAIDIANRALDLGVNLVDTAEVYGFGRSEEIVGRVLTARRREVFVATKLFPVLPTPTVIRWRAAGSLRRLGIDAIDLYQIHQPNPVVPLGWQMAGMRELMHGGKVRHAGVSNFSLARWQAAEGALGSAVLSNQVCFNLVERGPLSDLLPWAQRHGRLVIAYSPLAQGLLSARYDPDHRPGGMRASMAAFLPENLERARPLMNELREVARRHDATPAQVALAWVARHPNVVVIPGASTVAQVEANAEAAELEISDDEAGQLLAAAETYEPVAGAAALGRVIGERAKTLFTH